jgi:tetratricopeptide (TPR) repeat protein
MQIRRDYSQPLFGNRRRRRISGQFVFIYLLVMGGILGYVWWQLPRLQLAALDVIGLAPTATPFASWYAQQGYDLYARGDVESASRMFEQAVMQQPVDINYLVEYGRTLIDLDRDPDPANGRPRSDVEIALEIGDRAIAAAPNDPRGYALKAKALFWAGEADQAIPVAQQGLERAPNYSQLQAVLAWSYAAISRFQLGLQWGSSAVEADPMNADAHRAFAFALISVGQREEAIQALNTAININPNLTGPYFELAVQFRSMNMLAEAIATYDVVLRLEPRNARAMLRLCETYFSAGEASQAEGYCQDAIDQNPNPVLMAQSYRQLGMVNYSRRNYEGSIENFARCEELGSTEIQCYYLRGLAHYYLARPGNGNCELAWEYLNKSVDLARELPDSQNIQDDITLGLNLTIQTCPQYSGQAVATIAPTEIPPTPIGFGN